MDEKEAMETEVCLTPTERRRIISDARHPIMSLLGFALGGAVMGTLAFIILFPFVVSTQNRFGKLDKQVKVQRTAMVKLKQRVDLEEKRSRVVVDAGLVDRLNTRFAGTDLAGLGDKMVVEAGAYEIDPKLVAAVAIVETGGKNLPPAGIFGGDFMHDAGKQIQEYCWDLHDAYGAPQRGWEIGPGRYQDEFSRKWADMVEEIRKSI